MRLTRSAESSRSWIVKARSSPIAGAYSRSSRAPIAWKVPDQARPPSSPARSLQRARRDALDPPRHLGGGAAREGQQQDAARIGAAHDQVGDPVRQRVGLARAGAGDDEQRPCVMLDGAPLLGIERGEPGIGC